MGVAECKQRLGCRPGAGSPLREVLCWRFRSPLSPSTSTLAEIAETKQPPQTSSAPTSASSSGPSSFSLPASSASSASFQNPPFSLPFPIAALSDFTASPDPVAPTRPAPSRTPSSPPHHLLAPSRPRTPATPRYPRAPSSNKTPPSPSAPRRAHTLPGSNRLREARPHLSATLGLSGRERVV